MDIEAAVKMVVRSVRKTGKPKLEVIDRIWKSALRDSLSSFEKETLAKEGLLEHVRNALTNGAWSGQELEVVKVNVQTPTQETKQLNILIATCFTTADGREKSLMQFCVQDFLYCIDQNNLQVAGLERRNKVFGLGISLLESQKANSVQELSKTSITRLAEEWAEVVTWKEKIAEEAIA